jgi:hypothetical protein
VETVSHFDLRVSSRSPAHPANSNAIKRTMILIREVYPNYCLLFDSWAPRGALRRSSEDRAPR